MFASRRLVARANPLRIRRRMGTTRTTSLSHQSSRRQHPGRDTSALLLPSLFAFGAFVGYFDIESNLSAEALTEDDNEEEETTDVINWSGTHSVTVKNKNYFEPETVEEVEAIVKKCNETKQTVRPLGTSLSPNGIALNEEGMIIMANIDEVLDIDTKNRTVTVQAGITVQRVRSCGDHAKLPRARRFLSSIFLTRSFIRRSSKRLGRTA